MHILSKPSMSLLPIVVFAAMLSGCRSTSVGPGVSENITLVYSVKTSSHISLRLVNSYNTTVATLIDTVQQAGSYRFTWNTGGYPPGIYFYYFSEVNPSGDTSFTSVRRIIVG